VVQFDLGGGGTDSIWVAAGLMLAWLLLPMFIGLFAAVMTFSAVAIFVEKVVRG